MVNNSIELTTMAQVFNKALVIDYDSKTYELIDKAYNPIFGGNPFNVFPEDVYQMADKVFDKK